MARPIECSCSACAARREQVQKWNDKNRQKRREINKASKDRARQKLQESRALVSDEELDRRALAMGL